MRTSFQIADCILNSLDQDLLINGVRKPRANKGSGSQRSINTNPATGSDARGEVGSNGEDLAGVVRVVGSD